ncbi:HAD hydrolase family protein [Glycomyces sp. L485]|uniref:HAD hydrolase family protein n=1 Tax=Glycomyces sp. L485 TaxID=2909235 RepID=UPI001F4A7956|nr:HAD hydrolase family protein [Glycomyces sp. L485]MCH7230547.1 HAD hydrolase family protein [Glycomyces sp. L485]
MQERKVIATDLDGTLLDGRRLLSERNRKALLAARTRGFHVVAVTARSPRGVAAVPGLTSVIDVAICNNGAAVYEPADGAIELRRTISFDILRDLHRRLAAVLPDSVFAIETGNEVLSQPGQIPASPHYDDPWRRVDSLEEALGRCTDVTEYRLVDRAAGAARMLEAARSIDVPGVVCWHWGSFPVLEYNAVGVNKGDALSAWCAERDFDAASVIAFGDMPNDASMLAWAGSSYAMAGAQPEALEAADQRAGSNDEDGVAQVIESLLEEHQAAERSE